MGLMMLRMQALQCGGNNVFGSESGSMHELRHLQKECSYDLRIYLKIRIRGASIHIPATKSTSRDVAATRLIVHSTHHPEHITTSQSSSTLLKPSQPIRLRVLPLNVILQVLVYGERTAS
jgi:hypothetical protein